MALQSAYHSEVRPLIDAVDKIRELFDSAKLEIDLPSIAVIGNQRFVARNSCRRPKNVLSSPRFFSLIAAREKLRSSSASRASTCRAARAW